MSTEEMYDKIFGEGKFQELPAMKRLAMVDFSTLCRNDGANMMLETINEKK